MGYAMGIITYIVGVLMIAGYALIKSYGNKTDPFIQNQGQ
jgi:hypothetical protein